MSLLVFNFLIMTRNFTITKKAAKWLSIECNVYDKECLRLYMRCEVVNGSPDLTEVYRRGPMTLHSYSYEVSMFLTRIHSILAKDDFEKKSVEFDLSFDF